MIRYLTVEEVGRIHHYVIEEIGGGHGIRDHGLLESATEQPQMSFGGSDLYQGIVEKAATLGYSIVTNHPFLDGNKRTGYVAMRTFLLRNGYDISGRTEVKVRVMLAVASGQMNRETFAEWVRDHLDPRPPTSEES